ncbi:MAG: hypothetical protein KC766_27690, partial [Myxococcales bacterium]|nr:hypothetical protein [Myxococcales bacterium]
GHRLRLARCVSWLAGHRLRLAQQLPCGFFSNFSSLSNRTRTRSLTPHLAGVLGGVQAGAGFAGARSARSLDIACDSPAAGIG